LDSAAALQILIAEVRAEFALPVDAAMNFATNASMNPTGTSVNLATGAAVSPGLAQTPQLLVRLFLQALPSDVSDVSAWWIATDGVIAALQSALDRAVNAVAAWRDVPAAVVDVVKETRVLVLTALGDEPPNPLWLRPEWLGLAPKIQRYWRRRQLARRGLSDPDYTSSRFDDGEDNELEQ
jgi:hypothetical protein